MTHTYMHSYIYVYTGQAVPPAHSPNLSQCGHALHKIVGAGHYQTTQVPAALLMGRARVRSPAVRRPHMQLPNLLHQHLVRCWLYM
jgi:hypothetical protein